jgi:hypothetical protein
MTSLADVLTTFDDPAASSCSRVTFRNASLLATWYPCSATV